MRCKRLESKKGSFSTTSPLTFFWASMEKLFSICVVAGFQNYRFPAHCRHRKFKVVLAQAALNTLLGGEKAKGGAGRQKLDQQPEPFSRELAAHQVDAGNVPTGLVETCDNTFGDGIASHKDDGDGCRDRLRGSGRRCATSRGDQGRLQRRQFGCQFPQLIVLSVGPAILDLRRLALDVPKSSKPAQKA